MMIGKHEREALIDPVFNNNPITLQILGICSALAVTTSMKTAIIMAMSVTAVTVGTNWAISVMRNSIPPSIRIVVQLTVIAALVIITDQILKAFVYDVSKLLSVYVGLIITNCILMGRAEAYAMSNPPVASLMDGFGNGLGYTVILMYCAVIRELFGRGSLFGYPILTPVTDGGWYVPNGLLVISPGAFFLIAMFIWALRTWKPEQQEND